MRDAQNNPDVSDTADRRRLRRRGRQPGRHGQPSDRSPIRTSAATSAPARAKRLYRFTDETAINVMTATPTCRRAACSASGEPDAGGYGLTAGPSVADPLRPQLARCWHRGVVRRWTLARSRRSRPGSGLGQDAINPDLNAGRRQPVRRAQHADL